MGGLGSGRLFYDGESKGTVEDCQSLSISKLTRQIALCWDQTETGIFLAGSVLVNFELKGNQLRLLYCPRAQPDWLIDERIALTRTFPHFGGSRLWFCCPGCQARVGKLYLAPGSTRYRCRGCANLTYQSTRGMSFAQWLESLETLEKSIQATQSKRKR